MAHKHHITPRYKGGSNEKSNIIEVSVTSHAMFHYCNWKLWGDMRDFLAWKGLAGEIGKEEIINQLAQNSGGLQKMWERTAHLMENDPEYRSRNRKHLLEIQPLAVAASLTDESRERRKETYKKIKHQQGESNSQHGTRWITDGTVSKKIKKTDPIPQGFREGRKMNPIKRND